MYIEILVLIYMTLKRSKQLIIERRQNDEVITDFYQ